MAWDPMCAPCAPSAFWPAGCPSLHRNPPPWRHGSTAVEDCSRAFCSLPGRYEHTPTAARAQRVAPRPLTIGARPSPRSRSSEGSNSSTRPDRLTGRACGPCNDGTLSRPSGRSADASRWPHARRWSVLWILRGRPPRRGPPGAQVRVAPPSAHTPMPTSGPTTHRPVAACCSRAFCLLFGRAKHIPTTARARRAAPCPLGRRVGVWPMQERGRALEQLMQ